MREKRLWRTCFLLSFSLSRPPFCFDEIPLAVGCSGSPSSAFGRSHDERRLQRSHWAWGQGSCNAPGTSGARLSMAVFFPCLFEKLWLSPATGFLRPPPPPRLLVCSFSSLLASRPPWPLLLQTRGLCARAQKTKEKAKKKEAEEEVEGERGKQVGKRWACDPSDEVEERQAILECSFFQPPLSRPSLFPFPLPPRSQTKPGAPSSKGSSRRWPGKDVGMGRAERSRGLGNGGMPRNTSNANRRRKQLGIREKPQRPLLFFFLCLFFFSLSSLSFKKKKNSRQGSNPLKMGIPKRVPSLNSQVEARCREMGGDRAIHSVLVANNGLAAVKFIRSVRSWAYKTFGNERAVAIVAMATPEDMRIDAEHIRMADQFVEVS